MSLSKAYKDLKSTVDKWKGTTSLPEEAISIVGEAKSLAKDLSQKITKSAISGECDSTTFARELIREVEGARKRLEDAATSIYKAPGKREDQKAEDQKAETKDILMPDYDKDVFLKDDISLPRDSRANGYYFVILDDNALKDILGSTFHHLCKAMKEVDDAKAKNLATAEEFSEGQALRCPVAGCKKGGYSCKTKTWLGKHMLNEHPGYETDAKRRKLDASVEGIGSQAETMTMRTLKWEIEELD